MKPTTDPSHGLLACLADTSRFRLVSALTVGDRCVTELARDVGLSQSCTTRHLQALKQAGVVSAERQGKRVVYGLRADEPRVSSLLSWALEASTAGQPTVGKVPVRARRSSNVTTSKQVRPARPTPRRGGPATPRPGPAAASESSTTSSATVPPSPPDPAPAGEAGTPAEARPHVRRARPGDLEDFLL